MKRLILMRHAKSDWSAAAARDHDRPLNPRGRSAAQALGGWLRANAFLPDQVQSSTAVRTRETLLRLNLPAVSDVTLIPQLYLATPDQILSCLRDATGEAVLVLGHNPGIGEFAQDILSKAPGRPGFDAYPTGATLIADWDIEDWTEAHWANATARDFIVPRDLTAA